MYDTKKLYYEDVYKKEFTAKVLECRESKKGYEIILNQTAFYPEGGGQPSDTGILGGINVKEVHEKDGELVHYTDGPLEVGMDVIGKINWGRRFDLMQQHSGEHIVSGLEAEVEAKVEAYIDGESGDIPLAKKEAIGRTVDYAAGRNRYIGHLISLATRSFKEVKVGLDCSNGSSSSIAKSVFDALEIGRAHV